jgi:hypothetical protein
MYAIITHYRLNPIFEQDFLDQWDMQIEHLKSLNYVHSSILHQESKISYVSYTRWVSSELFEENLKHPDATIALAQRKIEECCNSISIPFRLHTLREVEASN